MKQLHVKTWKGTRYTWYGPLCVRNSIVYAGKVVVGAIGTFALMYIIMMFVYVVA